MRQGIRTCADCPGILSAASWAANYTVANTTTPGSGKPATRRSGRHANAGGLPSLFPRPAYWPGRRSRRTTHCPTIVMRTRRSTVDINRTGSPTSRSTGNVPERRSLD